MKKYEANSELEAILLRNGFMEVSSDRDKIKGKKRFKLSIQSQKEVYFDYINIHIYKSSSGQDSRIIMTENELKLLLLFFKLKLADTKSITNYDEQFKFSEAEKRIDLMRKELELLTELNIQKSSRLKIKRILHIFDNISIN